jgi:hypothetical protein
VGRGRGEREPRRVLGLGSVRQGRKEGGKRAGRKKGRKGGGQGRRGWRRGGRSWAGARKEGRGTEKKIPRLFCLGLLLVPDESKVVFATWGETTGDSIETRGGSENAEPEKAGSPK